MTSRNAILARFEAINVWKRGDQRAPHKPLLVLYALGRISRGEDGPIPFSDIDRDVTPLLREFGPPRKSHHAEYPFFWLQSDGIWSLEGADDLERRQGREIPKGVLLANEVRGGFEAEVLATFESEPGLVGDVAHQVLDGHFPETLHQDILDTVGLDPGAFEFVKRRRRDPEFRTRILRAYEHQCAVCGLDLRLGQQTVGIEAAHIRWHQAGGPDVEENGLALCSLHHKVFDLGAYTILPDLSMLVSEQAHGATLFDEVLMRFHGASIRMPIREEYRSTRKHLEWHGREVFRSPGRVVN